MDASSFDRRVRRYATAVTGRRGAVAALAAIPALFAADASAGNCRKAGKSCSNGKKCCNGLKCCGSTCRNLTNDEANCGACGVA